nr:MAG TPA: hypothetical protein [Caudoviricetes sp.]
MFSSHVSHVQLSLQNYLVLSNLDSFNPGL